MTTCTGDIAEVALDVETVRDGETIVDLTRKGAWCISLAIGYVLCIRVMGVDIESVLLPVGRLKLERMVIRLTRVEGTEQGRPVLIRGTVVDVNT